MPNRPRLRGRLGLVAAVAVAAASLSAVAGAAPSPKAQLATILSTARAQHSVHYVSRVNEGAPGRLSVTADVGRGRGVAQLRVTLLQESGSIRVIVIGDTAYVRGGRRGLEYLVGMDVRKATRYAGKWLSFSKGTRNYTYLAGGVTLRSFLHSIAPAPHSRVTATSTTVEGRKTIELRAATRTGETQFVLPPGGRLLIEAGYVAPGGMGDTKMSRWNERVRVAAPANPVALADVRG